MKKNVLALSIAAMIGGLGFAGAASAVVLPGSTGDLTAATADKLVLSEGGVGHMLLVPYYTAQNGNMTVLHVVNTDTKNGKAVKVRFRGAANSDDVLDFQVFMSPGDVWTAAVTAGANGIAQIVTADNTCTVPELKAGVAQSFFTARLNTVLSAPEKANQTREGYVEIFNMADIKPTVASNSITPSTDLYQAIKHVNSVAPCSNVAGARTLLDKIATTDFAAEAKPEKAAALAGFDTPTAGLMGDWYIINVPQTTTFSGASTAVVAVVDSTGAAGRGNFVHFPQSDSEVTGTVGDYTADPLLRAGSLPVSASDATVAGTALTVATLKAGNYDLPDMSTPYIKTAITPVLQAAALTKALAVKSITNQYANDASITAKTDWVFSMPTRRYSVAANYAVKTTDPAYRLFTDLGAVDWFTPANTTVDTAGNICVSAASQTFYNREEKTPDQVTPGPVFSPSTPGVKPVVRFCGETSVLSFADAGNSVLAANVARQNLVSGTYENGWGVIDTANGTAGLPILGAAFIKLSNPQVAAGLSGTYGITWPHRFTK